MALKFAGRTPSSSLRRPHRVLTRENASRQSRAWALRCAFSALIVWLVATFAHQQIDGFASISSTRSLATLDVFAALLLFVGETLRQSGS